MKANQLKFLEAATLRFGAEAVVVANDLVDFAKANGFSAADRNWIFKPKYRTGRALYKLPVSESAVADSANQVAMAADIVPIRKDTPVNKTFNPNAVSEHEYAQVPAKDKNYVAFGEFKYRSEGDVAVFASRASAVSSVPWTWSAESMAARRVPRATLLQ